MNIKCLSMYKAALLGLAVCLPLGDAAAGIIRVKSCVATIGSFCPVETGGGMLFVVAALFLAGLPLRWLLKRHVENRLATDPSYRPSEGLMMLYRNAGRITLLALIGVVAAIAFASS